MADARGGDERDLAIHGAGVVPTSIPENLKTTWSRTTGI